MGSIARWGSGLMSLTTKAARRVSHHARLVANRALAVFGHERYVRFIVLTRSRTGSNLLLSFLNSHPNVFSDGEIFARLHGKDPLTRLDSVFRRQPRYIKAKGFKIFYYHPLDGSADALWERLAGEKDIRVIHLTRRNILRTLVSRKIAGIGDSWTGTRFDAAGSAGKCVAMTVEELDAGFRQTREWEKTAEVRFREHPVLRVTYEELVQDPRATSAKVTEFLGVSRSEPRTGLRQQNPEGLRKLLSNYEELKKSFTGTPWQAYFDE
jgi:LPS sulfotransferase NodH